MMTEFKEREAQEDGKDCTVGQRNYYIKNYCLQERSRHHDNSKSTLMGSAVKMDKELKNLHDLRALFGVTKQGIVHHSGMRQIICLLLSLFYIHKILSCLQSGSFYFSSSIIEN